MVHYIVPTYLRPAATEAYYMKFCSKSDTYTMCALAIIIGFGAIVALYTLLSVYLGG